MNLGRRLAPVALASTLALAATGCGTQAASPAGTTADAVQVVTSFYPLQYLTEQVAGEHAAISTLTTPGQEPHDLELTAKQVASVGEAQLVVFQSGFQGAVDDAIETNPPKNQLDATSLVTPLSTSEEEGHEGESAEEHEGHDHGDTDPHIWLDPKNMVKIAEGIEAKLVELDPDHKADYEANTARLTEQLNQLDSDYSSGLKNCKRTEFITSHAAFGYLAHEYGLHQIGISGLSPDEEPSPARIAEVQKLAKEHGITTIFYETLVSPAIAQSIAGDMSLKTAVLDPVEGITDESKGSDYVEVMKSNLAALKSANECA